MEELSKLAIFLMHAYDFESILSILNEIVVGLIISCDGG